MSEAMGVQSSGIEGMAQSRAGRIPNKIPHWRTALLRQYNYTPEPLFVADLFEVPPKACHDRFCLL